MIIKNKDIIVVGLQPWDTEIGSNCKNIAEEFGRQNRVLYVNFPLDRITMKREKDQPIIANRLDVIKNKKENLVQVAPNIWNFTPTCILESVNWIPFTPLFRVVNRINNKRFASEIIKAIAKLNFKDFILFNDSDMFRSYHLKELLKPSLSVYYSRDNLMGVPWWHKHGHLLEPELFAQSDLVTANSTYLADMAREHNPRSFYVGQGCEVQDFDPAKITEVPKEVASLPRPVIGYIGALYQLRLNLQMLEALAGKRKDWSFVLIGPEDEAFKNSSLHKMANVHFLGLKEGRELPAYLAGFDVAINPQILNEVTIGNYPRKIDEYLAMGKPVVASETRAMSIFSGHVYFANTVDEYIVQIEKALKEDNRDKQNERISFARSHTWENSVNEIYKAMAEVKPKLAEPSTQTI
jgi:glycosyltransferase involved in cell wall biosynthesis